MSSDTDQIPVPPVTTVTHHGNCLCEGVRLRISGPLAPIEVCHCAQCRQAQGGPFATNIPVATSALTFLAGEHLLQSHASSPGKERVFCRVCGSPVFSRRAALPGVVRIRAGLLHEPVATQLAFHAFTASKASWWPLSDALPHHAGAAPSPLHDLDAPIHRSPTMHITVETTIAAPIEAVWQAWTTPADIVQWNAASADWHTTRAEVDLRVGGAFSSRMEARDGSMGFDFAGTYTQVVPHALLVADFGGRSLRVAFLNSPAGVTVRETFEAETMHSEEEQRAGWQAILDNFARHVLRQQGA